MAISEENRDSSGLCIDGGILRELVCGFTVIEPWNATPDSSLDELGLDSIAAVQLATKLLTQFQFLIHPDELFGISLATLAKHIQRSLPVSTESRSAALDNMIVLSVESTIPPLKSGNQAPCLSATSLPLNSSFNLLDTLAKSNAVYEAAAQRTGFANYWSTVSSVQDDLFLSYINEAFITLGVNLSEQPQGVEIPTVACVPKYNRLVKRLLVFLETRYIVKICSGKVLRGSDRIEVDASLRLCERLQNDHPSFRCETQLMSLIGPRLAECLSGKLDPLSVLFGSAESRRIMDDFYHDAPIMAAHTEQLVSFFISLAKSLLMSSQKPIRILEIGAGTGGTTAPLVAALKDAKVSVDYTVTDIGTSFVSKAKARWGSIEGMNFVVLDIEEEMPEGFRGKYDIVVGTNVVHATTDRTATCRRLRDALGPGGVLVLSELTRPINWYGMCFGLLDGWWLADGGNGYAIQPASVWMEAFEKAGFTTMGHSDGKTEEANTQQLLVACVEH
ncbi:hypothetical protein NPX13_g1851 [Xylaria arbuscula]|uniref:Carrier domain-containing protein n=1 Tax=Xylaria arbuscula TaxID=114810 RepID=A0A9W8NLV3_9PEZI|nr:hypothetical protein NPX13_g1851 [Xylaria arbuscula]